MDAYYIMAKFPEQNTEKVVVSVLRMFTQETNNIMFNKTIFTYCTYLTLGIVEITN